MNIRLETPADWRTVEKLTREAFFDLKLPGREQCDEHLLIHKMRHVNAFVPELDFVAEIDGKIEGHIAYTRSGIATPAGNTTETLTFGPLSVRPILQRRGIGGALVRHSLEKARELGYRAVVILGHPDYYPRFGFKPAATFGITLAGGVAMEALMALELYPGALKGISGHFVYDPIFEHLPADEVAALNRALDAQ